MTVVEKAVWTVDQRVAYSVFHLAEPTAASTAAAKADCSAVCLAAAKVDLKAAMMAVLWEKRSAGQRAASMVDH